MTDEVHRRRVERALVVVKRNMEGSEDAVNIQQLCTWYLDVNAVDAGTL